MAVRLADRHAQQHEVAATVAGALITRRPELIIRASVKHAEALIAPTKSSLYPAAADWLRRAKAAYAHSGQIDEWQEHDLGHTFATRLAERGVGETARMALLGQSSTKMVRRYSHAPPEALAEAVSRLARPAGDVLAFKRNQA